MIVGKFAVIDIGSNTIRLVVYENLERAPYVIFNEKVFCSLGRGVSETGFMRDKSIIKAVKTLRRFSILLEKMNVTNYKTVATSAVRDANNGEAFVKHIKDVSGLNIHVLSGAEEARLSGKGVICALPRAMGIIGDLGGGSLELATVYDKEVSNEATLPIGPLQLQDLEGKRISSVKEKIDKHFTAILWLKERKNEKFYAVGGSWRTLARIHMIETKYPLINMHNYVIPVNEITELASRISKMSKIELEQYRPYISSKRIKTLSLAAMVLSRLLKVIKPCKFIVSVFGVREGLLYNQMEPNIREQDNLITSCHQVAQMTGRFPEHGERLYEWIDCLFDDENTAHKRLRLAICILSDVGWRGHPEYRAEKVVSETLYGRLGGINHSDSSLIAMSLYTCYGGLSHNVPQVETAKALLSKEDICYAKKIGLALRFAQRISGGTSDGLKVVKLAKEKSRLTLLVETDMIDLVNDVVERRFKKLAKFLELDDKISS